MKALGADEVLDYRGTPFEQAVGEVDVVFDTVGGETRERSWGLLGNGGRMVTIASDAEARSEQRVTDAFFIVEANQGQLLETGRRIDAGELRVVVKATVPFEDAALAYAGRAPGSGGYGKVVVEVGGREGASS